MTECMRAQTFSDEEIIKRVRAGDTVLYEVLFGRYNRRLYYATGKILQNGADVEDAIQEAHLRAFLNLSQFRGDSSFSAWLIRIAINQALTLVRGRPRAAELHEPALAASLLGNPEQQALQHELREVLITAVNRLPPRYRTVFVLHEIEQLSLPEVVWRLGIGMSCAKIRLHRGGRCSESSSLR